MKCVSQMFFKDSLRVHCFIVFQKISFKDISSNVCVFLGHSLVRDVPLKQCLRTFTFAAVVAQFLYEVAANGNLHFVLFNTIVKIISVTKHRHFIHQRNSRGNRIISELLLPTSHFVKESFLYPRHSYAIVGPNGVIPLQAYVSVALDPIPLYGYEKPAWRTEALLIRRY